MSLYEAIKEVSEQEKAALATETEGAEHDSTDNPQRENNRGAKDAGSSGGDKPDKTATDTRKPKDSPQSHNKAPAADKEGAAEGRDEKGRFKKPGEKPEGADKSGKEGSAAPKEGAAGAEEKEELSPEAYAKLRRDLAAERRRREAAEARLPQAPTQPQPGPAQTKTAAADPLGAEPDPNIDPEAHTRWKLAKAEKTIEELAQWRETQERQANRTVAEKRAIEAYEKYEGEFSPTVQDYQEVTTWGVNQIKNSIRVLRPDLQGPQLAEAIRFEVLRRAAEYEKQGYNPSEQFYHDCKAWGYQPAAAAPEKPAGEEKPAAPEKPARPSMREVGKNQRRSGHSMTPGGKNGQAPMSRQAALSGEMTLADWSRLSPSQLREMESQEGV